jgi:hypothetical protein
MPWRLLAAAAIVVVLGGSVRSAPVVRASSGVAVYVGYAEDSLNPGSDVPSPWFGSPGVTWEGCPGGCTAGAYDAGAVRIVNNGPAATIDYLKIHVGTNPGDCTFDLWGTKIALPAGGDAIFTQTSSGEDNGCPNNGTLDTSDVGPGGVPWDQVDCKIDNIQPTVEVSIDGVVTNYTDTAQVLNTGGENSGICTNGIVHAAVPESERWQLVGTSAAYWAPNHMIDGSTTKGWESPQGEVANQAVTVGFGDTLPPNATTFSPPPSESAIYRFTDVFIDPAATHGDSPDADLKDFEIRASTDGQTFSTALTGTALQQDKMQQFHFPQPVDARELQIVALDNYGSPDHVAIAEFAAYSKGPASATHAVARVLFADSQKKNPSKSQSPTNIAQVRDIFHGLSVAPPHKQVVKGKKKMKLYALYGLGTGHGQKASIGFVEGTVMQLNQLTDVVLTSPHLTTVQKGEVQEVVKPGSNHQIQTSTAIASAVGTIFDVRILKNHKAVFTVLEGALKVKNKKGSSLVKTDQQSVVNPGKAPSPPQPANVQALNWTSNLSTPNLGQNLALDANGGYIIGAP